MVQAMALGLNTPQIDALGAYQKGAEARQVFDSNQIKLAQQGLETIGSVALGSMGGNIDGQADPALFEQGLDYLIQNGVGAAENFRGRPDLAPLVARSSMTAMQQLAQAQDERSFNLALEKFQFDVQQALQGPAPTAEMRNYDWAAGDPAREQYLGIGEAGGARPLTAEERIQWGIPESDTSAYSIEPGKAPERVGGAAPGAAGFNVSQAASAGYADRATQSDALLSQPALTSASMDRGQYAKNGVWIIGNDLTSAEFQQADQAKRDFINAVLRRESGAVIADSEFDNANKQYFPVPGDDEATIKQKAANRRTKIAGLAREAGPAYTAPDTSTYLMDDPAASVAGTVTEGTVIENDAGDRMVYRNGDWVAQ